MVHGASASTSALPLATAARNLRLSFSPTDRSAAPSPQDSFRLTSLWTRWVEARPHQRRASGVPVPRGIGSSEARVEWQPRQVRERGGLCTNTEKGPIPGKASGGPDRNSELEQGLRLREDGEQHGWEARIVGRPMLVRRGASLPISKEWRRSDTDDKNKSVCLLSRHVGQKHSNEMPHWRNGPWTSSRARSRLSPEVCQNRPGPRKQYPPLRRA